MKYVAIQPISKDEFDRRSKQFEHDSRFLIDSLLGLAEGEEDWKLVQDTLLEYVTDERDDVVAIALKCLGHTARIHGQLDVNLVRPIVLSFTKSGQKNVRASAIDTLDDMEMFL